MLSRDEMIYLGNKAIYQNLGQCFKVSNVIFDEQEKIWSVLVDYSYPTVIDDSKTGERYVRSIIFKNLFQMFFDSQGNLKYIPPKDDLEERIISNIYKDVKKIAAVLIDITAEKLIDIAPIRTAMTPFERIFQILEDEDKITQESIRRIKKVNKNVKIYLNILESLDLIRKYRDENTMDNYSKGNKYIEIEHLSVPNKKKIDLLLSYVLKHGYSLILEKARLYALVPFVRYQNIYYYATYRVGELVYFDEREFIKKSYEIYGKRPNRLQMVGQLEQLINAGILDRENHYYIGNEHIYKNLKKSLVTNTLS